MKIKKDYQINNILDINGLASFYGASNFNLSLLEKAFKVEIKSNNYDLEVEGKSEDIDKTFKCFDLMIKKVLKGDLNNIIMQDIIRQVNNNEKEVDEKIKFVTTYAGKNIIAKNKSQENYYHALKDNTIIFALGAAGTGKTFLAVCYAISLLKTRKIEKIIITRPIVEAGENLGFLPGEIKEKVEPYLVPIYDALYYVLGKEATDKYLERQVIEIAPLAYMRGRTLSNAFIILDEAQNTTSLQMKMFLTRLGFDSKMVITGDQSQIDLKPSVISGLVEASSLLADVEDITVIKFNSKDVVRHPLVAKIIEAYDNKNDTK